jgi:cysteine-rich repeat protein
MRVAGGLLVTMLLASTAMADPAAEARALLPPGEFTLLANHVDHLGIRTVTFQQRWHGMPVIGGTVGVVFRDGRVVTTRSRALTNIAALGPRDDTRRGVLRVDGVDHIVDIVEEKGPLEHWDIYRDALTGTELERTNRVRDASGTLEHDVGVRYAGGARTTMPAPFATIIVDNVATTTSATGTFSWTGTSPASVVTGISGTYARVINVGGASAMTTLSVAPSSTGVWNASTSELEDAQVSAYIYANIAKTRARAMNPSASAWTDAQTDVLVNSTGAGCNAVATGNEVHFYRANGQCENTARVGDIVFHELGHLFHNASIIAGMGAYDSHLSEGLSDFFAANITGDPGMGRGFLKTDEPLRNIDPSGFERVYPLDFDFDPHISGLIIAGALWDMRKALVAELGASAGVARAEQIFVGIMQRADDISTTFEAALIADDDDADLGNGTPNYCAIETTFGRHGLVPDYAMTTVAPPVITGDNERAISLRVTTPTGTQCTPLAVTQMKVTWTANDGVASEILLAASGDDWRGTFPALPDGTLVHYTVDITYSDGSLATFPNNEADPRYQLWIGPVTPLFCESFDADPMWEETSNSGTQWAWGAITSNPPDPSMPFTGTSAFGTNLTGDGVYRPNLTTSIVTPVIAVPAFESVRLQYRRWLTVEDGAFDQATIEANGTEVWSNRSTPIGSLDHVDREWRFHDIDITPWISDGTLQLAWNLDTDFGKELGGWTIDDVCVVGVTKIPYCGDGEVDIDEQCDDGNRDDEDGCTATCIDEVTAGGGGCCSSSRDAGGAWLLALGVLGWMRRRRR